MSQDRKFEFPSDPLDLYNARLDFEAESDRAKILYSDRVQRDIELVFGGVVNAGYSRRRQPPAR